MSEGVPTVLGVFHPWRAIRARIDITLVAEKQPGLLGSWCERTRTLRYDPGQNQAERRSTATHELIHAERGDQGDCTPEVERRVHAEAARRLITISALADAALYYGDDLDALAEDLWVDVPTLQARLDHLHPAERGYLLRRLSMKEHTA